MIVDESNQQSSSMDEGESTQTNSSSKNSDIKSTLTLLKKSEECSSNYFEETESLKYNSSYKAALPDFQNNNYRKSSTLSTNVSQSDFQLDSLSPKKSFLSIILYTFHLYLSLSVSLNNFIDTEIKQCWLDSNTCYDILALALLLKFTKHFTTPGVPESHTFLYIHPSDWPSWYNDPESLNLR